MKGLVLASLGLTSLLLTVQATAQFTARDPGLRGDPPAAGQPLPGLTTRQREFFAAGLEAFRSAEGIGDGPGPRFNLDSCLGCHSQPIDGGSSPAVNPHRAHRSLATGTDAASEASGVVERFQSLGERDKQDLLNFLGSL
jgi:hypothetical protein